MEEENNHKAIVGGFLAAILVVAGVLYVFNDNVGDESPSGEEIANSLDESPPATQEGFVRYENADYNFSLDIPEEYSVEEFDEGEGAMTFLFTSPNAEAGFQIFVHAFPEELPLTPERIREDVPDAIIEDPETITIAGGVHALLFWGESGGRRTREVWFPYEGNLYEVTARAEDDQMLSKIMATWDFIGEN